MKQLETGGVRVRSGARSGDHCFRQADNSWSCPAYRQSLECVFVEPYAFRWECRDPKSNQVVRSGSSENAEAVKTMLDQYVADLEDRDIGAWCQHATFLDGTPIKSLPTYQPFATCFKEDLPGITCSTRPDDSWYCKNRNGYTYITGSGGEEGLKQSLVEDAWPRPIHWK